MANNVPKKPRPFLLNYGLSMYILALITVICVIMTWFLPRSIDVGKGSIHDVHEDDIHEPLVKTSA